MATTPSPNKPSFWAKASKTLAFWILVILVPVAFIQLSSARSDAASEIDYTRYDDEVSSNNVQSVTITDGKSITGEFRQKVTVSGHEVKKFSVNLPGPLTDRERDMLREKKVRVTAEVARPSIGTVVLSWLPVVLIIAIWVFIFRQMQAGGN